VTVVAVPVAHVAGLVVDAIAAGAPVVTDVGSVKAPILAEVAACGAPASRYVGGHPMAGSELDGLAGADPDLFVGATWVLTPVPGTDADAHASVRALASAVGAEVVEVDPAEHDALVAVVSHVPQLAATTLMDVAADAGEGSALLLRLAAGGFRDMTRIAASHPAIWPDICAANRDAIVEALDRYVAALGDVRRMVDAGERGALLELLERARTARRALPSSAAVAGPLAEVRVPVADRPGVLAEVTTLAGSLGVNILDLEIVHSIEGEGGLLVLVVPASVAGGFSDALGASGYHPVRSDL
jgi:prephenate dehydrogenase